MSKAVLKDPIKVKLDDLIYWGQSPVTKNEQGYLTYQTPKERYMRINNKWYMYSNIQSYFYRNDDGDITELHHYYAKVLDAKLHEDMLTVITKGGTTSWNIKYGKGLSSTDEMLLEFFNA